MTAIIALLTIKAEYPSDLHRSHPRGEDCGLWSSKGHECKTKQREYSPIPNNSLSADILP